MHGITVRLRVAALILTLLTTWGITVQAQVVADPWTLDFGQAAVPIGQTVYDQVTLTNTGSAGVVLDPIRISFDPPTYEIVSAPTAPYLLPSGESVTVEVAFTPFYDSFALEELYIGVEDGDDVYVTLMGMGVATPTETACDDGYDNDMDGAYDCADEDCWTDPACDGDGDGVPDPDDNCPGVANPDQEDSNTDGVGDLCDQDGDGVRDAVDNCPDDFNPDQEDSDGDGIGDACEEAIAELTADPPFFEFRGVFANTEDIAHAGIDITNHGPGPVEVVAIGFTDDTHFSLAFLNDCSDSETLPFTLAEGQECTLSIAFHPETAGLQSTFLELDFQVPGPDRLLVWLVGTGLAAGEIAVSPLDPHDFGYQHVYSDPLTVEVENVGDHTLIVTSTTTEGPFEVLNPVGGFGTSLDPGEERLLQVRVKAEDPPVPGPGEYVGSLTIYAYDPDEPATTIYLRVLVPDTTWMTETLATGQTGVDMVVEEPEGRVHLCYYSDTEVTYATSRPWLEGDDDRWETTTVETFIGAQQVMDCVVAVDDGGAVHLAYVVTDLDLPPTTIGSAYVRYRFDVSPLQTIWEEPISTHDYSLAVATDEELRPHLVVLEGDAAHYVSGHLWQNASTSVWGSTHDWLGVYDIEHLGFDDEGNLVAVFGRSSTSETISIGIDMVVDSHGIPAWRWGDDTVSIEPLADSKVVHFDPAGELTVAGTSGNRVQLEKHRLWFTHSIPSGNPVPATEPLSADESGFHNNQGLEYTTREPQAVLTDENGNVHVLFSSGGMYYVRYLAGERPYECDAADSEPTTIQITEEVGPPGTGASIGLHEIYRIHPVVAYLSGTQVIVGRRLLPRVATLQVSPRRWNEDVGEISRPIFTTNTSPPVDDFALVTVFEGAEVVSDPLDAGRWTAMPCEDFETAVGPDHTLGVRFRIEEEPIYRRASLEADFYRWAEEEQVEMETTAEIVSNQIADTDGDCLSDELEMMTDTDPLDADTDDDGMTDGNCGSEDLDANGEVDPGETDPRNPDTDGDGLFDGTERGLVEPESDDTDLSAGHFVPDADPTTTTDPTNPDSDGDGRSDGAEDDNLNGLYEPELGETDPNTVDVSVVEVDVEFEPGRCPNFLKTHRKSFRVAIVGSNDFDVHEIDLGSVRLEGVEAIGSMPWDVAAPRPAGQDPCDCTISGSDGIPDKVLRFESEEVIAAIGARDGEFVTLTLIGNLVDGTPFFGRSCASVMIQSPADSVFRGD